MLFRPHILVALVAALAVLGGNALWTTPLKTGPEAGDRSGWRLVASASAQTAIDPALLAPRRDGDDFVMGAENAAAVIIEYASLTCPHCARFHAEVLPKLKSEYIDKGLVKYVYRDFPLDAAALRAAQIARCLPPERYFSFMDVLFRQQEQWASGRDANVMIDRVKQLAGLAGLSRERADACIADAASQTKIVTAAQNGEREYQVRSTPTLVINGKRHTGPNSFEELDKALRALVKKS